ncbi:MAG: low molecular weight phosphotyrosine protein phosphatase [Leptolyngbya sp. PLA2]|nr:low molecular weight phosphotyrosine protein phosphatase [Leptolyngbya sp. PL-A2]MCQ3940204.1 low molecular weight phosphotyrosine protein phosphatase [cyanobacterium CYA1]MCZ7632673.1 low molecular weight phosphotyrosine protein phosphatase [Phycisphaerales bacterium]MDL1904059.1 low molecular weight phosphotyrosine protein phosphatase [Synechococcales cyanobacterium CNB]GIK20189.1 MAG: protein-tyrosine-phosphatase [Planctomycetota bacterium]
MSANHETPPRSLLFVCLGNICRSPLAEGIFLHLAHARGLRDRFEVDSCGTGAWHVGERPDARAAAVARANGVKLVSIARRLDPRTDFQRFELILPMDRSNRDHLLDAGAPETRVRLVRSFDPSLHGAPECELDVPDPYYGGPDGFQHVYDMLTRSCHGLLDRIAPNHA